MIGDPGVVENCTVAELLDWQHTGCPNGSQVGLTSVRIHEFVPVNEPVYMMKPPGGDVVARLGFIGLYIPTVIDIRLQPDADYRLTADVMVPSGLPLVRAETTLWGVPTESVHDTQRMTSEEASTSTAHGLTAPPPGRPAARLHDEPDQLRHRQAGGLRCVILAPTRPRLHHGRRAAADHRL